jgi:hypothetical protein
MVPLPPLDAVITALPQKVPLPLAVTEAGSVLTEKVATLLSGTVTGQPSSVVTFVVVMVLEPAVSRM